MVFVCSGNICRSPIAEKVLAAHLERAGLAAAVRVRSAGTGGWHVGEPVDPRAGEVLRRRGYSDRHTARQVDEELLAADLLVALDREHVAALRRLLPDPDRVRLLRSFDPTAPPGAGVPDPYYGGRGGFDDVLEMIEAAAPGLVEWVRERM